MTSETVSAAVPVKRLGIRRFFKPSPQEFAQAIRAAEAEARQKHWEHVDYLMKWLSGHVGKQLHAQTEVTLMANDLNTEQPMLEIALIDYPERCAHIQIRETRIGAHNPYANDPGAAAIHRAVSRIAETPQAGARPAVQRPAPTPPPKPPGQQKAGVGQGIIPRTPIGKK